MLLLTKPASNQEAATTNASRAGAMTSARQMPRPSKAAAQAQANNSGTTAGDGPGATGLSQGMRRSANTTGLSMIGRIAGWRRSSMRSEMIQILPLSTAHCHNAIGNTMRQYTTADPLKTVTLQIPMNLTLLIEHSHPILATHHWQVQQLCCV